MANIFKNLALVSLLLVSSVSAFAHDAPCPYCGLAITQDTPTQDNEVVLRYGNKRIEYKCALCAIAQAKTKFKGDVTVMAPSTVKGKPIVLKRVGGAWTAPEGTVFVHQKGSHAVCQDIYRAASSRDEATAWAKAKGLGEAKILTLAEMVAISK